MLLRAHIQEPITVDMYPCWTPRVLHSLRRHRRREMREHLLAPIRQCALSQSRQGLDRLLVEIALRHPRVGLPLVHEEALDIASILEQQRMGFILRMALEENEQALALLHERIDARVV